MTITTEKTGSAVTARLIGELDHHAAESARRELDEAIAFGCSCLTLDMRGVSFMDSSGLGVILGRYRSLAGWGGRLSIKGAPKNVDRILRMAGVYALTCDRGDSK